MLLLCATGPPVLDEALSVDEDTLAERMVVVSVTHEKLENVGIEMEDAVLLDATGEATDDIELDSLGIVRVVEEKMIVETTDEVTVTMTSLSEALLLVE